MQNNTKTIIGDSGYEYSYDGDLTDDKLAALEAFDKMQKPAPGGLSARNVAAGLIEGVGGAIGQGIGGRVAGPIGASIGGAILGGAGNVIGQQVSDKPFSVEEAMAAPIANAVPGAPLAKAGAVLLAKEAGKQAAANVAQLAAEKLLKGEPLTPEQASMYAGMGALSTYVGKIVDPGKILSKVEQSKVFQGFADDYVKKAQALGIKAMPSSLNKNSLNSFLEILAGPEVTAKELRDINEELFTGIAAASVGVKPQLGVRLSEQLDKASKAAAKPYEDIRGLMAKAQADEDALKKTALTATNAHELEIARADPAYVKKQIELGKKAAANIDKFKDANFKAGSYQEKYKVSRDPNDLDLASKFAKEAVQHKKNLQEGLESYGPEGKQLYKQFEDARKLISQIKTIESALTPGEKVSASRLGSMASPDSPVTGNLDTLMRFAADPRMKSVTSSEATSEARKGMASGMADLLRAPVAPAAREILKSNWYQQTMAKPSYVAMPDFVARAARGSTQAALKQMQSEPNSLLQFYQNVYPRRPETQQQTNVAP
jgi:hypothetical protein